MGLTCLFRASQSRLDASRKVLRIRWILHVCTVVSGHTFPTTSGRPLGPSQTRKNTSRTPRLRMSVRTLIQNFAPSPPGACPQPEDVLPAVHGDADRGAGRPVGDLPVADLDH